MAVTSFIPKVWSARLLENLDKAHHAMAFVNTDYEGEIKRHGDRVVINKLGDITIKDYDSETGIDEPEALSTDDQELIIDQKKYFGFAVDDVDAVQAAGDLVNQATERAAYNMADHVDKYIFKTMVDEAVAASQAAENPTDNVIGTAAAPVEVTASNAYDYLIELRTKMVEENIPSGTWKLAVSPDFSGLLLKDARFVATGAGEAENRLQNGLIGKAAGFEIYETNNLPTGGTGANKWGTIIATTQIATSFAEQLVEIKAYEREKYFDDAVKGLHVYGVKVTRPECVNVLYYKR